MNETEEIPYNENIRKAIENLKLYSNLEFQENFRKAINSFYQLNLNDLVKNLPSSRKSTAQTAIKNLTEAYTQGNLVLVIGAGISMNYGIPSWNSLLQRLLMRTIEKETNKAAVISKVYAKIFNPSPLIAGRYLQETLSRASSQGNNFEKEVRNALYETYDKDHISLIMDEIVRLCIAPGNNPNLDGIITYNYDDTIETKLRESKSGLKYQTIYGKGWNPDNKSLPYHVHGFLPKEGKLDESNIITLGEFIYHEQYNAIYSWNNMVQINKFRDKSCLFIGSSLTDPNIRRLLDIANTQKNNNKFHYIVKIRPDKEEIKTSLKLLFNDDPDIFNEKSNSQISFEDIVNFITKIHERFEERDSESLGVKTVWIESFEKDISDILMKIREKKVT